MFDNNSEKEIKEDLETESDHIPFSEIDVELLNLKDEYMMKKLFTIEHNEESKSELATLRFKIRMIEAGIKTND